MIEAAFCLIFGGAIVLRCLWQLREDYRSKEFPAIEGTFLTAIVDRDENYKVKLIYRYSVNGNIYTFHQNAKSWSGNIAILTKSRAEEIAESYNKKKEKIELFYDPLNPKRARLEIGYDWGAFVFIAFGTAFFLVGLRLLIYD